MIKKITSIKDFGIFKDFKWNNDIPDFKQKNIIYGWNYSGKTTLSRIFTSVQENGINDDFERAEFSLITDEGEYSTNNLEEFPYQTIVFNTDYIKEKLRWGYDDNISAIFFEVGENIKISQEIEELLTSINSIEDNKQVQKRIIEEFQNFEIEFTKESKRIKNDIFSSLIEFNKGHFKKIKDQTLNQLDQHIIESEVELLQLNKRVKIEQPNPEINEVQPESRFSEIFVKVKDALNTVPSKSDVLHILDSNIEAFNWAKLGVKMHQRGDKCIFCNNTLGDQRYKALINFFENQSSKLKEEITSIKQLILEEQHRLEKLNFPASFNDFNQGFQDDYKELYEEVEKALLNYKKLLKELIGLLEKKSAVNLYTPIELTIDENSADLLIEKIKNLNRLIKNNNDFTEKFEKLISTDRKKYQRHLVALFLRENKYLQKKESSDKASKTLLELNNEIKTQKKKIKRLKAQKESDSEGCVQFNSFIQSFLGRDDIEIILNSETKKFNLMRGDRLAQNLSEGEKTAISFSHFLVSLKSIDKRNELDQYIIYIDDPISSLDSNHIFQINSLLKDIFFKKTSDHNNVSELRWNLKCRQLFISTHNFEFFNLLKELPTKSFGKKGRKEARYFINRHIDQSFIEQLPPVYNTFSSEYHYLFSEIIDFYKDKNKMVSNKLFTLPNIIRRFLEMYTLTKYPSNDEVDGRAEIVFGVKESKRILKLLHYFSHFNNIDRINKHSEFVADIEHACDDLIQLIKEKDKMHYEALMASLN